MRAKIVAIGWKKLSQFVAYPGDPRHHFEIRPGKSGLLSVRRSAE